MRKCTLLLVVLLAGGSMAKAERITPVLMDSDLNVASHQFALHPLEILASQKADSFYLDAQTNGGFGDVLYGLGDFHGAEHDFKVAIRDLNGFEKAIGSDIRFNFPATIPEPATLPLLLFGAGAVLFLKRK